MAQGGVENEVLLNRRPQAEVSRQHLRIETQPSLGAEATLVQPLLHNNETSVMAKNMPDASDQSKWRHGHPDLNENS